MAPSGTNQLGRTTVVAPNASSAYGRIGATQVGQDGHNEWQFSARKPVVRSEAHRRPHSAESGHRWVDSGRGPETFASSNYRVKMSQEMYDRATGGRPEEVRK
jgi:hypothetical protein